jgi:cAMP-binding proteins - catabolite gene activator and regulatory subunit of cAMP-dependent protein kinases
MAREQFDRARLKELAIFVDLPAGDVDDLVNVAQIRHLEKGAALFEQGDPARAFFVLADGRLKVTQVTADGQQVTLRYIGPGEMFGCVAVSGQSSYPGTASAVVDSVVLAWQANRASELIERHPKFGARVLRTMGDRVQEAHARLREMATERVERRVARTLLRLAREAGKRTEHGIAIDIPLSRQDIAEMTGTTLYTVSRILSAWENEGIVDAARQHVVIRTPHALVKIAEDLPE